MSLTDHRGAAYAVQQLMQAAADDITNGKTKGATQLYGATGGKSFWERQAMRLKWKGSVVAFGRRRA